MSDEPIPVSLALKAVERAIKECDAATPGPWRGAFVEVVLDDLGSTAATSADDRFAALARAGFRGTLEYLRHRVALCGYFLDARAQLRAAVAPLIAHYDRVAPGWRAE